MTFMIKGLDPLPFRSLFDLGDEALAAQGAMRVTVDKWPGFPCRISLEDAKPGETVLLLNHVSHDVATPYRATYAIYVREGSSKTATFRDALPPVMERRPIALRLFDAQNMLIGADLGRSGEETLGAIRRAFEIPRTAYIHAHNAMHGCFAAAVVRD